MTSRAECAAAGGQRPPGDERTWLARADLGFYAVASPFGSSAVSARIVLDAIAEALGRPTATASTLERFECARLRGAILAAGEAWDDVSRARPEHSGLGATVAAVLLVDGWAAVAQLGDCRVLQLRKGAGLRRTTEHITLTGDKKALVIRFVGARSNPEVHAWPTEPGDTFVLTAGVHERVHEQLIVDSLRSGDLSRGIQEITQLAEQRGGSDYLTALGVRIGTGRCTAEARGRSDA
jgi:serine/threonine protein phosphatase PrpC